MRDRTLDDKRSDLKAALRGLAVDEDGEAGRHCGLKRLTAYHLGGLAAAEQEAVQEHLSRCPRCNGLLRELREFEAAAASGVAGPEALKRQAWESLVQRLPAGPPAVRPLASAPHSVERHRRLPLRWIAAALLAAAGLCLWGAATVVHNRRQMAHLEQRLGEREAALADLRRSAEESARELAAARRRIRDLERESTGRRPGQELEQPAATPPEPRPTRRASEGPYELAAQQIEVTVGPRFVLRGQEIQDGGLLRAGGAVNSLSAPVQGARLTVALSLSAFPAYEMYRLQLVNGDGRPLWSGSRPAGSMLGDAGTSVSFAGLEPGVYRLAIAGLVGDRAEPLAEYVLAIAP